MSDDEPMLRPTFLDHQHDAQTFAECDDFLLGRDLLAARRVDDRGRSGAASVRRQHAPATAGYTDRAAGGRDLLVASVVEPGARQREVWLPDNQAGWYDFYSIAFGEGLRVVLMIEEGRAQHRFVVSMRLPQQGILVEPGARQREVWLPDNQAGWYDFYSHQWFAGGQWDAFQREQLQFATIVLLRRNMTDALAERQSGPGADR
jgi:alpha-glucosidase (family GH31 glycosyl hydrolase)